jgi:hypothetical protein
MYLRIPTDLSAYPPRYTNASVLNARCAILAWMKIEENNRVRLSDGDDGGSKDV